MEDFMRMPNFLTPVIHVLVLVYCLIPVSYTHLTLPTILLV